MTGRMSAGDRSHGSLQDDGAVVGWFVDATDGVNAVGCTATAGAEVDEQDLVGGMVDLFPDACLHQQTLGAR